MKKRLTNKDYEKQDHVTMEELPGGDNIRLSVSKGMSLDFGKFSINLSYSADFRNDEVEEKYVQVKNWIDKKIQAELKAYKGS